MPLEGAWGRLPASCASAPSHTPSAGESALLPQFPSLSDGGSGWSKQAALWLSVGPPRGCEGGRAGPGGNASGVRSATEGGRDSHVVTDTSFPDRQGLRLREEPCAGLGHLPAGCDTRAGYAQGGSGPQHPHPAHPGAPAACWGLWGSDLQGPPPSWPEGPGRLAGTGTLPVALPPPPRQPLSRRQPPPPPRTVAVALPLALQQPQLVGQPAPFTQALREVGVPAAHCPPAPIPALHCEVPRLGASRPAAVALSRAAPLTKLTAPALEPRAAVTAVGVCAQHARASVLTRVSRAVPRGACKPVASG